MGVRLVLVILMLLTVPLSVGAQKPHDWIMKNSTLNWCCGPRHCQPISSSRVYHTGSGYGVRGWKGTLANGDNGLYNFSGDGRIWACRSVVSNSLRCLFIPRRLVNKRGENRR